MARSLASALDSLRTLIGPRVTFWRIVLWANRLNDWNTMPTSARSRARALPSSGRATPSIVIVPDVTGSSRLMHRIRVDLPDPDGPMTISTSPRSTCRSMSWRTCRSPKNLLTLSTTTSGGGRRPVRGRAREAGVAGAAASVTRTAPLRGRRLDAAAMASRPDRATTDPAAPAVSSRRREASRQALSRARS